MPAALQGRFMALPEAPAAPAEVTEFIARWQASGASERANYQLFLTELCAVLGVPGPDPATPNDHENAYVFERHVDFHNGDGTTSKGSIDLYRRGCFVLEAKQGADKKTGEQPLSSAAAAQAARAHKGTATRNTAGWERAMAGARGQAENYCRALPAAEGRPPFVVVADVGHCLELYSEFTRSGGAYVPYPDPRSHRILLQDLVREDLRERLRLLWTDPLELDPSRRSAQVTREIADRLARLAKSLEAAGHRPKAVAGFLMRCLFTMFAEDVQLLPRDKFTGLLRQMRGAPEKFQPAIEDLWRVMNTGGFHSGFMETLLRFNGGLFKEPNALPLDADQLELLIEAAEREWRDVEPAIFGTLLERALDPHERHKLGAHYTPRAYVERLVLPTIVEPLRAEWDGVQAAVSLQLEAAAALREDAAGLRERAKTGDAAAKTSSKAHELENDARKEERNAVKTLKAFLKRLCEVRILDPACGSGNFLYVALEHLKRLEGEVLELLQSLSPGEAALLESEGITVDPHQLLGIEINPRAAAIAELVLWIGYLQWHYRTHGGVQPPEPVIKDFKNIECRDAVLAYDEQRIVLDPDTHEPVTRWDGRTTKKHPVTGEDVPDDSARTPVYEYTNPRPAVWPEAEFVVGNPPFIGQQRMRTLLGDGYVDSLRIAHPEAGNTADYVMYWWLMAAMSARKNQVLRFGLITTNSISQHMNRQIVQAALSATPPVSIVFAIPDHPWVDSADGADVRIAMTVVVPGTLPGELYSISRGAPRSEGMDVQLVKQSGILDASLQIGADVHGCTQLQQNVGIAVKGFELGSQGFLVDKDVGEAWIEEEPRLAKVIRPYMNGRDLRDGSWHRFVIDFFGYSEDEFSEFGRAYQRLLDHVKPERLTNREDRTAKNWWLFRRSGADLRNVLSELPRYIATTRTAKFRVFQFLPREVYSESKIVVIGAEDAFLLGTLSSSIHVLFSNRIGGRLGVGNDPTYNHVDCFNKFPFPDATESQRARIRELAERLDAHRKAQQAAHPGLTMTGMYNVLEKLRSGEALTKKEQAIHAQGLVSVLKEIHDALDAAVSEAYGWPADLAEEEILSRLVALNAERAAEEAAGHVRWLRPEFQNPQGKAAAQLETPGAGAPAPAKAAKAEKRPWPKDLPARAQAVRAALSALGAPAEAAAVAACFKGAQKNTVAQLLQTLAALGQCRELDPGGRYVAV